MDLNQCNSEKSQDRVQDTIEHFDRYGDVMFRQQRTIYNHLAEVVKGKSVLEAGCGNGLGTAMLERTANQILGTDKELRNVDFANALYPWITFATWDITQPSFTNSQIVIAVEVLEHITNSALAIKNLFDAADEEVWISTPNGTDRARPPDNPYHVCEYTPEEMLQWIRVSIGEEMLVSLYDWRTFNTVSPEDPGDPVVYRIVKR